MNGGTKLVQVGVFRPVLDTLQAAGANVDAPLRKSSLDRFCLDNKEHYVPVNCMYSLFDEVRKSEGIEDFFECFAQELELQNLCSWGEAIAFTPDVLSACQLAVKHDNVIQTHERIQLAIDGTVSRLSQFFIDDPTPGRDYADYVSFSYMLSGFRLAGGPDWAPLAIHLQSPQARGLDRLLPEGSDTRIYLGEAATAIVFPTAMLAESMLGPAQPGSIDSPPANVAEAIESLLTSTRPGPLGNMNSYAEMLDMSPRTLRRHLAELDTSFSDIVENWRFKTSLRLLRNDRLRIKEIAARLCYANPPNFERAFNRWTGRSPGSYRDRLQTLESGPK